MDPNIKREWIEALRSGKYQQGQEQLRDGDKFCCLGVLCDILKDRLGTEWRSEGSPDAKFQDAAPDLPPAVMEAAGLSDEDPEVGGEHLTFQNDNGMTFPEIADLIERHL